MKFFPALGLTTGTTAAKLFMMHAKGVYGQ